MPIFEYLFWGKLWAKRKDKPMLLPTPTTKEEFLNCLEEFTATLNNLVHDENGEWTIKGFIDVYQKVYPITSDTKIVSKILEIQLLPYFIEFAGKYGLEWRPAERQNWYPDMSFISKKDPLIKFAVDIKTTYRIENDPSFCNGFTLGSHGQYFIDRNSTKNIQFPYSSYKGHFTLGIIYSRKLLSYLEESKTYSLEEIEKIPSVITALDFFAVEKWKIASDKSGSGNTANIGSIYNIDDIKNGRGVFSKLGENYFDEYWMTFGKIPIKDKVTRLGKPKFVTSVTEFLKFKEKDDNFIAEMVVPKKTNASVLKEIKKSQLEIDLDSNTETNENGNGE